WGRPSFVDTLEAVANTFETDRERIENNRSGLMQALKAEITPTAPIDRSLMMAAGDRLVGLFDTEHGGIKGAPKFPQASVLDLIWRIGLRGGNDTAKDAYLHTLRQISNGGIYDHLRGGIARYSVDHLWLVPHFEKMLYDNGQYLGHLVNAYQATGDELFRRRIEETSDWLLSEMKLTGGAFASSLDADSEGEEGRFYVWSSDEITEVLGEEDALTFAKAYDVHPSGNWEGITILNRLKSPSLSAKEETRLAKMREKLLKRREGRIRPSMDDKVLADWNGYAIAGFARASRFVSRESYLEAARTAYDFVMTEMSRDGRIGHSWRNGTLVFPGFATDQASMMVAALALAEADPDRIERYIADAENLATVLEQHYQSEEGAYFLTADDAPGLITRPFSVADEATPNANGTAAEAFSRLYLMTGKERYKELADKLLVALSAEIPKNIFATASLLSAFDTRTNGRLAVIVAPEGTDPNPFIKILNRAVDPALMQILVTSTDDFPEGHPAKHKNALDDKPTVYLCREGACSFPIQSRRDLESVLQKVD
ncbi:MAG: thioredoxin domain-containing protein, partial [Roseibium sp.]